MSNRLITGLSLSDKETEQQLIAAVMTLPFALDNSATQFPRPDDFFFISHTEIWRVILALHAAGDYVDWQSVQAGLIRAGGVAAEVVQSRRLDALALVEAETHLIPRYAAQVIELAARRAWLRAAEKIAAAANDRTITAEEIASLAGAAVKAAEDEVATADDDDLVTFQAAAAELYDSLEATRNGTAPRSISVPIAALNRTMSGLKPEEWIVVAARPGMGKSALLMQWAVSAAQQGQRVLYCPLEMSPVENVRRVVADETGISTQQQDAVTDDQWRRFVQWINTTNRTIWFDPAATQTPDRIRRKAARMQKRHGLDLIIVDYLQLMKPDQRQQNEIAALTEITRAMKQLARELKVPVVTAAQMNRGIEYGGGRGPKMSDLRGSGTIEQDADKVLFIWSQEQDTDQDGPAPAIRQVKFTLAKHRNGPEGAWDMVFQPDKLRFFELAREESSHYANHL